MKPCRRCRSPVGRRLGQGAEVQTRLVVLPKLIGVVVIDGLRHAADDVVPLFLGAVGPGKDDGRAQEELEVDEVGQLIAGHKGVGVTRPTGSSYSTNAVNKQLGPETWISFISISSFKQPLIR